MNIKKHLGWIIPAIIVVIIIFWGIGGYNGMVSLDEGVQNKWADVETQYQRRADLIPNLVNTVKGYAEHEKSTFDAITKLRSKSYDSMSANEKVETNQALGGMLGTLIATAEAYPELKANQNFLELQKNLNELENDIADSRKYYNGCVRQMNTAVESFPSNIIAGMFHFEKYRMYEVDDASERQNVVVDFGNAGQAQ